MRKVYPVSLLACLLLTLSASAQPKAAPPSSRNDHRPLLVCFGDSLTAGAGVDPGQSYPDDLQTLLDQRHIRYRVDNQGVSGNTTKDGVQRLPQVLALHPSVAVVEFGGNDGLRGLPIADTRANLDRIVATLQRAGIRVALAGITLPPDYGPDYIRQFNQTYTLLARKYRVPMLPFLLKDVYGVPGMMQPDRTHATAKGNQVVARNVLALVLPLLKK
jgi:acyl-CoA thioesterase-1